MDIVFIIAGLVLLFAGGEALIRGSVAVSEKLGISPILIGVVIVGFGTSTPELLVSVQASLAGSPAIALGNVVGSNIANVLLILAVAALITPIACADVAIKRDAVTVVAASALVLLAVQFDPIGRVFGGLFVIAIAGYIYYSYWAEKRQKALSPSGHVLHEDMGLEAEKKAPHGSLAVSLAIAVGGIVVLIVGARFLVDGATSIARAYGVSEAIIGLSLVAVGTSLPELAAAGIGAWRKQTDLVVGNILGSNLYNILGILGITSLISPIPVDPRVAGLDVPIMLGVAVLTAFVIFAFRRFGRATGLVSLLGYAVYVGWMFLSI